MDFFDLVKKRRSVHNFIPGKEITEADFKKIIEYTSLTPSGYNAQPWEFVLIRDKSNLNKLQEIAFDQSHISQAGAAVVVLGDMDIARNVDRILEDWLEYGYCKVDEVPAYRNSIAKKRSDDKRKDMALRNSMLAAMTFIFAAENMGFATCPMMGFREHALRELLQIPEDRIISLLIAVGYADASKEKPRLPRKKTEEMIYIEKFGERF